MGDLLAAGVERAELERIGMALEDRQRALPQVVDPEGDLLRIGQPDAPGAAHPLGALDDLIGLDEIRLHPFEAEQDRVEGAVAAAGRGERAEDVDLEGGHLIDPLADELGEARGRPHRPHGVGARRADADGEEVEDADRHGTAPDQVVASA